MSLQKTLTKPVKKYGNSGGVYLPSSWIGGEVEISLVQRPPKPEIDILLAFADYMKHVICIFVYGSYARGDNDGGSDIDVMVVVDPHAKGMKVPPSLKRMNYDVRIVTVDKVRKFLTRDAVLVKSMEDARAIFNGSFLKEIMAGAGSGNVRERVMLAKSSLGIIRSIFEAGGDNTGIIYPLIMRIKEMLLVRCVLDGKRFTSGLLEENAKRGGLSVPEFRKIISAYRAVRDGNFPESHRIDDIVFLKLFGLLEDLIGYAEKKEKA